MGYCRQLLGIDTLLMRDAPEYRADCNLTIFDCVRARVLHTGGDLSRASMRSRRSVQ